MGHLDEPAAKIRGQEEFPKHRPRGGLHSVPQEIRHAPDRMQGRPDFHRRSPGYRKRIHLETGGPHHGPLPHPANRAVHSPAPRPLQRDVPQGRRTHLLQGARAVGSLFCRHGKHGKNRQQRHSAQAHHPEARPKKLQHARTQGQENSRDQGRIARRKALPERSSERRGLQPPHEFLGLLRRADLAGTLGNGIECAPAADRFPGNAHGIDHQESAHTDRRGRRVRKIALGAVGDPAPYRRRQTRRGTLL